MKKAPKRSLGDGEQPEEGVWVRPIKRGYKMVCCDCGLVHRMDFDHIPHGRGRKVIIRAWRDDEETVKGRTRNNAGIPPGKRLVNVLFSDKSDSEKIARMKYLCSGAEDDCCFVCGTPGRGTCPDCTPAKE